MRHSPSQVRRLQDDTGTEAVIARSRQVGGTGGLVMGRGLLLWLIGIPLPIILLIWIFGGLH